MARSTFGQISGALNNGGKFYTSNAIAQMEVEMPGGEPGETELAAAGYFAAYTNAAVAYTATLALSASCYSAAHALMTRILVDLTASVTGASGTGSMDANRVLHLSGSYETARLAGL